MSDFELQLQLVKLRKNYAKTHLPINLDKCVLKLYNERITLTKYHSRRIQFKRFNEEFKVKISTGELLPYTFADAKRYAHNMEVSVNRAKTFIDEICQKNAFDFFVTITFRDAYVDRKSAVDVAKLFKNVIKRLKYQYGGMIYFAVPEYHKDKAIHYHLFAKFGHDPKLKYNRSSGSRFCLEHFKKEDCYIDFEKLDGMPPSGYLKKYINKNMERPLYRRFSCSRNLNRTRLITSVHLPNLSNQSLNSVVNKGLKLWTSNRWVNSYRMELPQQSSAAEAAHAVRPPRLDLSIHYTKDEKADYLLRVFLSILNDIYHDKALGKGKTAVYTVNGKNVEVGGKRQLGFVFN